MSEQPVRHEANAAPARPASDGAEGQKVTITIHRSWKIAAVTSVIMVLLALIGVGLTTASSGAAPVYWMSLVPIYGFLCVAAAWGRKRPDGGLDRSAILRQVLHWLGIAISLWLDFSIRGAGAESNLGAGFSALLLLALGCYLAGVHLHTQFIAVAVLLSLTLIVGEKAFQYLWLIFIVVGIAVAAMVGLMFARGVLHGRKGQQATSAHPAPVGS
jgi:hypothetical protein